MKSIMLVLIPCCFLGMFFLSCKKDADSGVLKDIDGNVYGTLMLAGREWMSENLKTTRLNDGTAIPEITDNYQWKQMATSGYCWYLNDKNAYSNVYGALYNHYTVATGKLCPLGWRVPTQAEWYIMAESIGGEAEAGGKMKETGTIHWLSPNVDATNSSGFLGLPGGYRSFTCSGGFALVQAYGYWWTADESSPTYAWARSLIHSDGIAYSGNFSKVNGISVRCIKQ